MEKVKVKIGINGDGRITPYAMAGLQGVVSPCPPGIKAYIVFIDIGCSYDDIWMQWVHHDAGLIRGSLVADHYILTNQIRNGKDKKEK